MHNDIRSYNIGIFENTMAKIKEVVPEFRKRFKAIEFAVYCRGADTENYEAFKEAFG